MAGPATARIRDTSLDPSAQDRWSVRHYINNNSHSHDTRRASEGPTSRAAGSRIPWSSMTRTTERAGSSSPSRIRWGARSSFRAGGGGPPVDNRLNNPGLHRWRSGAEPLQTMWMESQQAAFSRDRRNPSTFVHGASDHSSTGLSCQRIGVITALPGVLHSLAPPTSTTTVLKESFMADK